MIRGRATATDSSGMTRRAWRLLVCGLVLVAAAASGAAIFEHEARSASPIEYTVSPVEHTWSSVFSPAKERIVQTGLRRRGLDPQSAGIVGLVMRTEKPWPFALLAAKSRNGQQCFVPVLGVQLGPTTCGAAAPMVVFITRDRFRIAPVPTQTDTSVLGVAGSGVAAANVGDRRGACTDMGPVTVGGVLTFLGTSTPDEPILRAYDAGGRVIASIDVATDRPTRPGVIGVVRPTVAAPRKARPGRCWGMTLGP
ncbi:MAG: hypothetical protein ACXVQQ_08085 [Gaiellaceae bacterium]